MNNFSNGNDDINKSENGKPPSLSRRDRNVAAREKTPKVKPEGSSENIQENRNTSKMPGVKGKNTKRTLIIACAVISIIIIVIVLEVILFLPDIGQMKSTEIPGSTAPITPDISAQPDEEEYQLRSSSMIDINEVAYKTSDISEYAGNYDNIEIQQIDFDRVKKNDPNIFAWIYLKNSEISSPVVDYDDKKIKHANPLRTSSSYALKDERNSNDFQDTNTIIYGKHTENGMFSGLLKYARVEFYDSNPVIMLYTKKDIFALEVFSVYESALIGEYNPINFKDEDEYFNFIEDIKNKSLIKTWVDVTSKDKIVTLITDQDNLSNAVLIVHAKITKVNVKNAQAG